MAHVKRLAILACLLTGCQSDNSISTVPARPTAYRPTEEVIHYQRTTEGSGYDPYGFWGKPTEERGTIRYSR